MLRLICLIAGYGFGLIQTGFLYGKAHKIDIREHGSGNSGTTNALRVMGARAGAIVFLGDFLKAFLGCLLMGHLCGGGDPQMIILYKLWTGLGVVLGHNYPFYLQFRGGKGIASTGGAMVSLGFNLFSLVGLVVFAGTALITRFVSLASLLLMTVIGAGWVILSVLGKTGLTGALRIESIVLVLIFTALGFWRHRSNIHRLLTGTENKLGQKKKE